MSVQIAVRAPNHKVADQKFTINLGYTVNDVKVHLQLHYPGNPKPEEQKLIYMGKLLDDSSALQDILNLDMHDEEGCHIFHLVCRSPEKPSDLSITEKNGSEVVHKMDKLAQESVDSSADIFAPVTTPAVQQSQSFTSMPWSLATSTVPTMVPGMPYTAEQMIWLQQIYAQQMANYMHLVNHGYEYAETERGGEIPAQDTGGGAAARPAQNNQQMVMNAAGGQAVFEDEDEDLNRDWLDWSYIMCRFAVLLAIVYFYSTLGRFFMVFGFFFFIYLYQNGWFRLNRRVARQEARPQQEQAEVPEENQAETPGETNIPAAQEGPGLLKVILSFFVTFFTSLIPQQPAPVNAN